MEKLNLNPEEILNKNFKTAFKGYDPNEVDAYLDQILEDYQIMEDNVQELLDMIKKYQDQVKTLNQEMVKLEGKQKVFDLSNTTAYSSVDILKRISRLEEQLLKK